MDTGTRELWRGEELRSDAQAPPAIDTKRFLFITGCPRSGTSGMWSILGASPQIVIGNEWFAARPRNLTPDLFTRDRFLNPQRGSDCGYDIRTHADTKEYVHVASARFANATYVGDKIPYLYQHLDLLAARFPGAKVVFMIRDIFEVAASYKRRAQNLADREWTAGGVPEAIADWNASLSALANAPAGLDILPVHYRRFYMMADITPLMSWLGVGGVEMVDVWAKSSMVIAKGYPHSRQVLTPKDVARIAVEANLPLYDELFAAHVRGKHTD